MKVLHVISGISRSSGGPSRSSQGLASALCQCGVETWIYPFDGAEPWIAGVRRAACLDVGSYDLVHLHGIWDTRLHRVAVACRKAGVPYVIAPRGMLEPWSLKQKWLKKQIARWLYQDRDLKCAAALHATADSEAEQFRKLGFKNKIIISPNGVNVPSSLPALSISASNKACRALFVSRMHPKKGVLELVEAWARVKKEPKSEVERWICEFVYTMNSDEERAYEQKVKQRILDLGMSYQDKDGTIHGSTSRFDYLFTGPLDDNAKWDAYARADLFVLPTYSENFGIVVAEALWVGVPVITTKGTPWRELETWNCGKWIDLPSCESWAALDEALQWFFNLSADQLQDMRRNGHRLVESKYTWAAACQSMIAGYENILGGRR